MIIYKVKNSRDKYQYYIYLFLGFVSDEVKTIIMKFKNLNLEDTLEKVNKQEYQILSEYFKTEHWFNKFFNKHHINHFLKTNKNLKKYEDKFNITFKHNKVLYNHKFTYGFNVYHKNVIHERITKKIYSDDDHRESVFNELLDDDILIGGKEKEEETEDTQTEDDDFDKYLNNPNNDNIDNTEFVEDIEDNGNIEIEKEEENPEYLKKIENTDNKNNKEIDNLIGKQSVKSILNFIDFDNSKNESLYDEDIKNCYNKNYIFDKEIKKSDTIQEIKEKIFYTIKNKDSYGKLNYLEPSRLYLWSEYLHNGKYISYQIEKEIIKNNNLLKFPVEPINIYNYLNLTNEIKGIYSQLETYRINNIIVNDKRDFILNDRIEFIDNDEIYVIDIYNEIGPVIASTIQDQQIKNIYQTFIYLYFDQITFSDLNNIIGYILGSSPNSFFNEEKKTLKDKEEDFIKLKLINSHSSFVLKSWIDNVILSTYRKKEDDIKKLLVNTCITRIQLKINLHTTSKQINNIDTYTIFNELNANDKFLFIQYTKLNGTTLYKFDEKSLKDYINKIFKGAVQSNLEQVIKWFDISQSGLLFKYQYEEGKRPLHIYIDNFGRLSFDIYANCENHFKYENLTFYKNIIRNIIVEINKLGLNYPFILPEDIDYTVKFVNSIKDINIKSRINYNDLSDFVDLFYPYFANIVEPKRKKQNTNEFYGRSGVYLRYKKISDYNTKNKIIKTIWKYRKYYDSSETEIVNQICKEFNLSQEDSQKLFNESLKMRPNIKQVRNLKKITNKTKFKSEGVSVEIQHKDEAYVIKYHGLRNEQQDEEITQLLLTILYLYNQIYILKNKKYQYVKDKIKDIKLIAKRKLEILNYQKPEETKSEVKLIQKQDSDRLKFKPDKNKSVWSRLCQNSGKLRRQPKIFNNIDALIKYGYKHNKATGYYERQVKDKKTGKTTTLKAINLSGNDETPIYYTCNPEINGTHMYIGLLNKLNPNGKALPCCFINDKLEKQIEKYKKKIDNIKENKNIYNINYILQNVRYVPLNRIEFLPNILNYFFNELKNKKYEENQHILKSTDPDYYFISGTSSDQVLKSNNNFIFTIAYALDITFKNLIDKVVKNINDKIFNALNNGMIKIIYETKEKYIKKLEEIKKTELCNMKTEDLAHVLTIPGIIEDTGLNIIIIEKKKQDYLINYVNNEEIDFIDDKKRKNIILFFNGFEYSIITRIYKNSEDIDHIKIKTFTGEDEAIENIKGFYKLNINILSNMYGDLIAKKIYNRLTDNNYNIKYQVINTLNKTVFFIIKDKDKSFLIPTVPSGSIYNIELLDYDSEEFNKSINDYETIIENIKLYETIGLKFIGFYYYRIKNDFYYCRELILSNGKYNINLPIKKYKVDKNKKDKSKLFFYKQYYKNIDNIIKKYPNIEYSPDERVKYMEYEKYKTISYEYFRYGISRFILKNPEVREQLINIVNSKPEDIKDIRRIIYSLIENREIHKFYKKMTNDNINNNIKDKFNIIIYDKDIIENKIKNYDFNKNNIIKDYSNSKKCLNIMYSLDKNNKCTFSLSFDLIVDFINRICYELLNNGIKCYEILNLNGYFISSVINTNIYKLKKGQKIIKKNVENKKNVFVDYLKENPQDVRDFDPNDDKIYQEYYKLSYKFKKQEEKINNIIFINQGKRIKSLIFQPVYESADTFLRALVNCIFWISNNNIKNNEPMTIKNLGYYNIEQDKIINYMKSQIIDNILYNEVSRFVNEKGKIKDNQKLILKVSKNTNNLKYNDIIKILNIIYEIFKYPILIIDTYNNISFILPNSKEKIKGLNIYDYIENHKEKEIDLNNTIIIKNNNYHNKKIEALYYVI